MDLVLLDVLTKLGFAGLCVWLVMDTRREARSREERMSKALDEAQASLARVGARSAVAMENVVIATNRLSDALGSRPCLIGTTRPKLETVAEEKARGG